MIAYYVADRILRSFDEFWVEIRDGGGGGGGGGGGDDDPPLVDAGPDRTGDEASPVNLYGLASDDGGAPEVTWSYTAGSDVDAGASCVFGNAHSARTTVTCDDDGVFTVRLTASDGINPAASDTATVTLRNVPPRITSLSPSPWQVYRAGVPVPLKATFTDAANDTHTCTVAWDDGTPADGFAAPQHSCERTHTFAHAGMYTIKVTVRDDDGGTAEATTMVVVYDPNAGFDNADGKFTSPAGAWTSQPAATGDMNFHLTARYYNPNTPTGAARAYLANTNLRYDIAANGLEWLVVTPDGKVAAKGTGTINGQPGYGFVFYGYDGCTASQTTQCQPGGDRFRIVLWPLASGTYPQDDIVYDNRTEAGYDIDVADPQSLTSGEVRIHPPVG